MKMKKDTLLRTIAVMSCLALLLAAGCISGSRSKPSRFYTLDAMSVHEAASHAAASSSAQDLRIGIVPVNIPEYLKKSQIVTRTGSNEITLAEFDRWAGSLDEDIGRVVAENLSLLLKTDKVLNFPWRRNVDLDYTIEMQVSRLEGSLGGDVDLVVRWAIFDAENSTVVNVTTSRITQAVQGDSYSDLVASHSQALAVFSQELAAAIRKLTKG
jgi:uncharacterized lipoprotein YmbA